MARLQEDGIRGWPVCFFPGHLCRYGLPPGGFGDHDGTHGSVHVVYHDFDTQAGAYASARRVRGKLCPAIALKGCSCKFPVGIFLRGGFYLRGLGLFLVQMKRALSHENLNAEQTGVEDTLDHRIYAKDDTNEQRSL